MAQQELDTDQNKQLKDTTKAAKDAKHTAVPFNRPKLYLLVAAAVSIIIAAVAIWMLFMSDGGNQPSQMDETTANTSKSRGENIKEAPYKQEVLAAAEHLKGGVVEVLSEVSAGSGYLIHEDGYFLTNRHVVNEGDNFQIKTVDGTTIDINIVAESTDPEVDLALLKAEDDASGLPVMEMGDSSELTDKELLFSIAHPGSYGKWAITAGKYIKNPKTSRAARDVWINKPGSQGESGGPAFNIDGEVVGTVYGANSDPGKERLDKTAETVIHWGNAEQYWTDVTNAVNTADMQKFISRHVSQEVLEEIFE